MKSGKSSEAGGLERRAAYRFSILASLSGRSLAGMYTREYGLAVTDWKTLCIVGHYQPLNPGVIAWRTSMEPEKVSRALDRLMRKGLVARTLDPGDRRRLNVTLSKQGEKVFARIEEVRERMESELLGALSAGERATLFRLLDKLDVRARESFGDRQSWRRFAEGLARPRQKRA